MTTISAKIIADSISDQDGVRLCALELKYPAFFHQDLMTHRVFSRNASSTRAIPIRQMIRNIINDMAMPVHWGVNRSGMQATDQLTGIKLTLAKFLWRTAGYCAVSIAFLLYLVGAHKQVGNMILWPFMHFTTLVSSTEWDNFFELRDHPDARPEIQILAQQIKIAINQSSPKILRKGQWHLPYVTASDRANRNLSISDLIKISVARSARVSYLTHDSQKPSLEKDLQLYDRLVGSKPWHASPTEHQATPTADTKLWGNFRYWGQARKMIEHGIEFNGF